MERYCDLNEISDGRLYQAEDMVKVSANGCKDCSQCCRIIGESIILDPYDVYELTTHMGVTMQELLVEKLELHVVDGLIMPNIKTQNDKGGCGFLNEESRCGIHSFRPGFCRMFPLGRYYENNSFHYILQVNECPCTHLEDIQVAKWLGIPEIKKYEQYIIDWHYYIRHLQQCIKEGMKEDTVKQLNMYLLQLFFFLAYDSTEDFYTQFYRRFNKAKEEILL